MPKNRIGSAGTALLANASHFSSLTSPDLRGNVLKDSGITAIAQSTVLVCLTHLHLAGDPEDKSAVLAIANPSTLSCLIFLGLDGSDVEDDGAAALAQHGKSARCLTHFELPSSGIGDIGAAALISGFPNLVHLDLNDNRLGWEGAKVLAESGCSAKLTYLNLRRNHLGDEGVHFLAESPHFRSQRHLDLSRNSINKNGSAVLARSSSNNFPRLVILLLLDDAIDLEAFANCIGRFCRLELLDLRRCQLTQAEVLAMAKSTNFPLLARLDLDWNDLDEPAVRAAFESNPNFPRLAWLQL